MESEENDPTTEPAAEWVDVMDLQEWRGNPRRNAAAVRSVAASIKRHGFGAPIVARRENGEIIAGHTRYKAAMLLGMTEVPVRYLDISESDAQHLVEIMEARDDR